MGVGEEGGGGGGGERERQGDKDGFFCQSLNAHLKSPLSHLGVCTSWNSLQGREANRQYNTTKTQVKDSIF